MRQFYTNVPKAGDFLDLTTTINVVGIAHAGATTGEAVFGFVLDGAAAKGVEVPVLLAFNVGGAWQKKRFSEREKDNEQKQELQRIVFRVGSLPMKKLNNKKRKRKEKLFSSHIVKYVADERVPPSPHRAPNPPSVRVLGVHSHDQASAFTGWRLFTSTSADT